MKNIIILGGGSSGWLTAAYMLKNLMPDTNITLIEDKRQGPIGVGEGTQPATAQFLYDCGLHPVDWMSATDATFKYGVELDGWTKNKYFVDNEPPENSLVSQHLLITDYFGSKSNEEWTRFQPSYQMAKKNISPKWYGLDTNFNIADRSYGAVHFNALKIVDVLAKHCVNYRSTTNRFKLVETKITDYKVDENGIKALIDEEGNFYKADLYIDCSGFKSMLLEGALKEPHIPYKDILLCDKAVAMPKSYTNPKEECHPYTKAITMNAGWRWQIPPYERIGNGYCYSSKHITPEQAEKELRDSIGEDKSTALHIDIKAGTHKHIALKNVCAVGLAAGFIEPLEANNLTWTTSIVRAVVELLNNNNWQSKEMINGYFNEINDEILAFIFSHYYYSTKDDTPFWQEIRNQSKRQLPQPSQQLINDIQINKTAFFYRSSSMFNLTQWFSMLHAGGGFNSKKLPDEIEKYAKYFIANQYNRVEQAKLFFKNHYEYLSESYGKN